jgi:hypothetical protein
MKMIMNDTLRKMLEEAFVAYFNIHFLGRIAKNYGNLTIAGTNADHTSLRQLTLYFS